jgi:hypothetical protein
LKSSFAVVCSFGSRRATPWRQLEGVLRPGVAVDINLSRAALVIESPGLVAPLVRC